MNALLLFAAVFSASFTNDCRQVALTNLGLEPDAGSVECRWTVYRDGDHFADGAFGLSRFRTGPIKPGESVLAPLPPVLGDLSHRPGALSLRVRFSAVTNGTARLLDVVQLELPTTVPPAALGAFVPLAREALGEALHAELGFGPALSRKPKPADTS